MTDDEIRERARRVRDAFHEEVIRDGLGEDMSAVLARYGGIANCVAGGEYHREGLFVAIVDRLRKLGNPLDDIDTDRRPKSPSVAEAADNACDDTMSLWRRSDSTDPTYYVVSRADDLMHVLVSDPPDIERESRRLHDAVTKWIEGRRGDGAKAVAKAVDGHSECLKAAWESAVEALSRSDGDGTKRPMGNPWDMPVKVIRQLPRANARRPHPRMATVCLWPDGTETHAVPSEDDRYNPHTGLLVCLVKRMAALRGSSNLASMVRNVEGSNRDMRADEGMSRAAAHRLALLEVGCHLYAMGMDGAPGFRPASFADYVVEVSKREVSAIAEPMAEDFCFRLAYMREEAARLALRDRDRAERERRLSALRDEAAANGADEFEAWAYALDHARMVLPDFAAISKAGRITDEELESIDRCAWDEARSRIYGAACEGGAR